MATDSGTKGTTDPSNPATTEPVAEVKLDGLKVVVNVHVHFKVNVGNYESVDAGLSLTVESAQSKGAADRALGGIRAWLKENAPKVMEDALALHKARR